MCAQRRRNEARNLLADREAPSAMRQPWDATNETTPPLPRKQRGATHCGLCPRQLAPAFGGDCGRSEPARAVRSQIVHSRRAADRHAGARIWRKRARGARRRLLAGSNGCQQDQLPASGDERVAADSGQDTCFGVVAILSSERRNTIEIVPDQQHAEVPPRFRFHRACSRSLCDRHHPVRRATLAGLARRIAATRSFREPECVGRPGA
jgi:hypothetical protein